MTASGKATILYDGDCALCRRFAGWVRRHDRRERFDLVPYQDAAIAEDLRLECEGAVHVVTPSGRALRAGRAVLFILYGLGYRRTARAFARAFARAPLLWGVELGYRIVASNRSVVAWLLRL